jgi:hypothetical protein
MERLFDGKRFLIRCLIGITLFLLALLAACQPGKTPVGGKQVEVHYQRLAGHRCPTV